MKKTRPFYLTILICAFLLSACGGQGVASTRDECNEVESINVPGDKNVVLQQLSQLMEVINDDTQEHNIREKASRDFIELLQSTIANGRDYILLYGGTTEYTPRPLFISFWELSEIELIPTKLINHTDKIEDNVREYENMLIFEGGQEQWYFDAVMTDLSDDPLLLVKLGSKAEIAISFENESFVSTSEDTNVASFYGTWKVTELAWYHEQYFVGDIVAKEMQQEVNKPIEGFVITIEPESYTETALKYNHSIDKPQYLFDSYNMCNDSDEIYNTINNCRDYLETLNITNKPINYLAVRDPIKNKMDSGEIDWYFVPTPVFIYVDDNTILLTANFVELYKCERIVE